MSAHTPGPWFIPEQESQYGIRVASVHPVRSPGTRSVRTVATVKLGEQDLSNARLIAAAPRMFDRIAKLAAEGDAESLAIMEAVNGNA